MDSKCNSKKTQKKLISAVEKGSTTKLNSSKKKKKSRKSSSKADGSKCSDPSPDNLEIEGVGVRDATPGVDSDSSQTQCQDQVSKTETTSTTENTQNDKEDSSAKKSTSNASLAPIPRQNSCIMDTKLSSSLSNLSIPKQKSAVTRGVMRQKSNVSNVQSINQKTGYQFGAKFAKRMNDPQNNSKILMSNKNESLRWDNPADNSDDEEERIRVYKMNRRKRYLAAAQAKGLGWAANYRLNGSPLSEDSGIDTKDSKENRTSNSNNSRCDSHGTVPDYSAMKGLVPSNSKSGLAMVEC